MDCWKTIFNGHISFWMANRSVKCFEKGWGYFPTATYPHVLNLQSSKYWSKIFHNSLETWTAWGLYDLQVSIVLFLPPPTVKFNKKTPCLLAQGGKRSMTRAGTFGAQKPRWELVRRSVPPCANCRSLVTGSVRAQPKSHLWCCWYMLVHVHWNNVGYIQARRTLVYLNNPSSLKSTWPQLFFIFTKEAINNHKS